MRTQSQNTRILKYLQSGKAITAVDSLNMFGCARLASRINELRGKGWPIEKRMIRTNGGAIIAEYYMGRHDDTRDRLADRT